MASLHTLVDLPVVSRVVGQTGNGQNREGAPPKVYSVVKASQVGLGEEGRLRCELVPWAEGKQSFPRRSVGG